MPVLLDSLVVVAQRPVSHEVHMVSVVESIVGKIVTSSRRDGRHHVQVVHLGYLKKVPALHHDVHHLRDVQAVQVIVIGHILAVALVDLTQEAHQLYIVEVADLLAWQELWKVEEHLVGDGHEGVFAAQRPIDFEAVEVN